MKKKILVLFLSCQTAFAASAQNTIVLQSNNIITLPIGALPCALAIADLNADSRTDIAVCEKGLGQIGVYLQTANGTFPAPVGTYPAGLAPTGLVAVAMGNQITRPRADLVAISGPSSKWTVLMNDGNGQATFTPLLPFSSFGTGQVSTSPQLVAAYLDRDSFIDFAYTYDGFNDTRVKWDAYLGSYSVLGRSRFNTSFVPGCVAIDDFDRDGATDMVTTNPLTNELFVVYAEDISGSPNWSNAQYRFIFPTGGSLPTQVATGDVNRDNLPDIAVAHAGSNDITLFLNLGFGRFGSQFTYHLSAAPRQVLLEDLNRDGYPEMLVLTADNKLQLFQHTQAIGPARYDTPQLIATGLNPVTMQVADIDGDLTKDVVVGCSTGNSVHIYLNRTFAQPTATNARQLAAVEVFPNPATSQLLLRLPTKMKGTLTATLLDRLGKTVREVTLQGDNNTIPVADLVRGLYVLRLTGVDGVNTRRIVLE